MGGGVGSYLPVLELEGAGGMVLRVMVLVAAAEEGEEEEEGELSIELTRLRGSHVLPVGRSGNPLGDWAGRVDGCSSCRLDEVAAGGGGGAAESLRGRGPGGGWDGVIISTSGSSHS